MEQAATSSGEAIPPVEPTEKPADGVPVKASVTIEAPVEEIYRLWAGFENLPRIMDTVATVEAIGEGRTRWTLRGPVGRTVTFDAEITDARPNERIAWRTIAGSGVTASGEVRFRPAPGGRGTQLIYEARFVPPGGAIGEKIAGLFSDALGLKVGNDLRRAKQLIELGEIVHSDDSIAPGPNPARPLESLPPGFTVG